MKLSLILATVGRSDDVGRFIRSLAAQTDRRFELIVVDQNTDDRLLPFATEGKEAGLDLQHLRLDRPSLSGARNLGIKYATGELLGFPDDDCWYEPETISNLLTAFDQEPEIEGVVGCWVEQAEGSRVKPVRTDLSLEAWRSFRGIDASSISLFFRRSMFERLGGFDERLGVGQWYGAAEETDFVLRALAASLRLACRPDVRMHHHFVREPSGDASTLFKLARRRARGTGAIYAKHRLSSYVIARGLIAPVLVPLVRGPTVAGLARGLGMIVGRVEGLVRWYWRNH